MPWEKELDKINNITHIDITSAIELTDEKKDSIKNRVAEKLQQNVVINWKVDKDIIAGLVISMDEKIIDLSLRHQFEKFEKQLIDLNMKFIAGPKQGVIC